MPTILCTCISIIILWNKNEYFQNYILSKILIMFTKEYGTENVGKSYMFKTL